MKQKFIIFLLFVSGSYFSVIQAQVKQVTIIDELETSARGEGTVKIICDSKITALIGTLSPEISVDGKNYIKTNGFRVQVLMSNDPKMVNEINNKGSLIKGTFPEIAVYTGYTAPNWKLLAGDFMTKEEADVFCQKLQKAIPELGKEMYVVQDKINVLIQKDN